MLIWRAKNTKKLFAPIAAILIILGTILVVLTRASLTVTEPAGTLLTQAVSNQILVKLKVGVVPSSILTLVTDDQLKVGNFTPDTPKIVNRTPLLTATALIKHPELSRWFVFTLSNEQKNVNVTSEEYAQIGQHIEFIKKQANVEAVEPNYVVKSTVAPNDPYYSSSGSFKSGLRDLWGLQNINPEPAWNVTTGSNEVVIADIDTGVDRNHRDLASNMWVNPREIPDNNVDDDLNGYVDDYHGWDFNGGDKDPMDDHGHGTHTAGTIAAAGNNGTGVTGVNWVSKILAIKFLNSAGSGYMSRGALAIIYAADNGAKITSNSWGCQCYSQLVDDAFKYAHQKGVVNIAAAGNSSSPTTVFYPASSDYVITVAAHDVNNKKASFSNFGRKSLISAPGVDILSLRSATGSMCTTAITVASEYCYVSGTSMAAPHVAGIAGLILARNSTSINEQVAGVVGQVLAPPPSYTNERVRQVLEQSGRTGYLYTPANDGGNTKLADATLALAQPEPLVPFISFPRSNHKHNGSKFDIRGTVSGQIFATYRVEAWGYKQNGFSIDYDPTPIALRPAITLQPINDSILAEFDPQKVNDGDYEIRLVASSVSGVEYSNTIYSIKVDNFAATIKQPMLRITDGASITGFAKVQGTTLTFDRYELEWRRNGQGESDWARTLLTLTNNGGSQISDGEIARMNTTGFQHGEKIEIRLRVYATDGVFESYTKRITLSQNLLNGWPKSYSGPGYSFSSYVQEADLDKDGNTDIISTPFGNQIEVFNPDGSYKSGFPANVGVGGELITGGEVNIADLDGDGKQEIIIGAYLGNRFSIYIFRSDGSKHPKWPRKTFTNCTACSKPHIAAGDLNGDGIKELVWARGDYRGIGFHSSLELHAFNIDGTYATGFPQKNYLSDLTGFYKVLSTQIHDLDNDQAPEVIISYTYKQGGGQSSSPNKAYIIATDTTGKIKTGWPVELGPYYFSSSDISYYDVDGDTKDDLIFPWGPINEVSYLALGSGGVAKSGWPKAKVDYGHKFKIFEDKLYTKAGVYSFPSLLPLNPTRLTGPSRVDYIQDYPLGLRGSNDMYYLKFVGSSSLDIVQQLSNGTVSTFESIELNCASYLNNYFNSGSYLTVNAVGDILDSGTCSGWVVGRNTDIYLFDKPSPHIYSAGMLNIRSELDNYFDSLPPL